MFSTATSSSPSKAFQTAVLWFRTISITKYTNHNNNLANKSSSSGSVAPNPTQPQCVLPLLRARSLTISVLPKRKYLKVEPNTYFAFRFRAFEPFRVAYWMLIADASHRLGQFFFSLFSFPRSVHIKHTHTALILRHMVLERTQTFFGWQRCVRAEHRMDCGKGLIDICSLVKGNANCLDSIICFGFGSCVGVFGQNHSVAVNTHSDHSAFSLRIFQLFV